MDNSRLDKLLQLHEADPTDAFCCYGIALEHAKSGDHRQAIDWFDKTLNVDEGYFYAYYQKAKSLAAMSEIEAARRLLRTGMDRARGGGDAHAADEMSQLLETLET